MPHSSGTSALGASAANHNDLVVCGNLTYDTGAIMGGGNALYVMHWLVRALSPLFISTVSESRRVLSSGSADTGSQVCRPGLQVRTARRIRGRPRRGSAGGPLPPGP